MKKIILLLLIPIAFFISKDCALGSSGASLYFSPNSGTFYVGSTFDVSIFLNTGENNINAVYANLKFDPKKLQIASPTAGKSFISVWISQPTYSNKEGTASFMGGNPSPGINTSAGLVSTITFRIIAPGETTISFADSQALLDDGHGTNILNSTSKGIYKLSVPPPEGPEIFSSTHSDQNKWYKNNNPTLSWVKEDGVTDFSYGFDYDPQGVPDNISEGSSNSISYSDLEGGIWYFHVKAEKASIWGGTSHYLLQIDNIMPAAFTPTINPALRTSNNQPLISFITTDSLSGFDHFEAKVINITPGKENQETGFFMEVTSPYKLSILPLGKYMIVIRAFDKAGNWRDASLKLDIIPGGISFSKDGLSLFGLFFNWWIVALMFFIIMIIITGLLFYSNKKQKKLGSETMERLKKREEELKKEFEKIKNMDQNIQ